MALLYKHPHQFMVPASVQQAFILHFLSSFCLFLYWVFVFLSCLTLWLSGNSLFAGFSSAPIVPWGTEHRRFLLCALLRGKMEDMSLLRSMLSSIHKMTPLLKRLSRYAWSSHTHCRHYICIKKVFFFFLQFFRPLWGISFREMSKIHRYVYL